MAFKTAQAPSDRDRLLYELAAELTSSLQLEEVLRNVMDRVLELMHASRGYVVLVDPETHDFGIRMARSESRDHPIEHFHGSRTVIEQVINTREAIQTLDASLDRRFMAMDSVIANNLRSIAAVPLISKDQVIGALYVDNPFRASVFSDDDTAFLQAVANQAAIAIENARLYTELKLNYDRVDFLRRTFERYVNKQVMERVLEEPNGGFLAGEKLRVTMLASDLAGFSALTRKQQPEEVVAVLNDYYRRVVDVVLENGGNINKFEGDGFLTVFGAPVPVSDSAERAVATAVAIRGIVAEINQTRARRRQPPLEAGIGIDTGDVIAGNIGSERRLEYTVIGVSVNNAAFLARLRPAGVFISKSSHQALRGRFAAKPREPVLVKGAEEPLAIYELV